MIKPPETRQTYDNGLKLALWHLELNYWQQLNQNMKIPGGRGAATPIMQLNCDPESGMSSGSNKTCQISVQTNRMNLIGLVAADYILAGSPDVV